MRRALVLATVVAVSTGLAPAATAQMNPRGEAKVTLAGKPIVVEYGRPSLKGRDMLSRAAVGDEWRMGADGATTLDTPVALSFGSTRVAPGKYVLRARKVSDTEWALKLVRDDQTAAEVPLKTSPLDKSVEVFTIDLAEEQGQGLFRMSWGNLALATRFSAK
ncbi:MAG TPA: DUF2911 domain-containing protein [Vicinamibacteria bacterium]|nr:DUF2911 domain-containing protein [Vicinamibacteria bacterium]